jgi:hypothetical protein
MVQFGLAQVDLGVKMKVMENMQNKSVVVGICGKPGVGKDTIGGFLQSEFGFKLFTLKKPIEETVKAVFGVDDHHLYNREAREQPILNWPGWTVRKMLQAVGQTMRDAVGGTVWAQSLCERMDYNPQNSRIVVTDVRTPEDLDYIRTYVNNKGGKFIMMMVKRPGFGSTTSGGFADHKLESYDLEPCCDIVFHNEGSVSELFAVVAKFLVGLDICDVE